MITIKVCNQFETLTKKSLSELRDQRPNRTSDQEKQREKGKERERKRESSGKSKKTNTQCLFFCLNI